MTGQRLFNPAGCLAIKVPVRCIAVYVVSGGAMQPNSERCGDMPARSLTKGWLSGMDWPVREA